MSAIVIEAWQKRIYIIIFAFKLSRKFPKLTSDVLVSFVDKALGVFVQREVLLKLELFTEIRSFV